MTVAARNVAPRLDTADPPALSLNPLALAKT